MNGGSTPVKPQRHSKCLPHANEELELCNDDIAAEGYVLNKARQEDEEIVRIAPSISGHLRSHQVSSYQPTLSYSSQGCKNGLMHLRVAMTFSIFYVDFCLSRRMACIW